ncbi:MAG: hypothetical protein AAFU85_32370, partial [Planctomycetota bacterium]
MGDDSSGTVACALGVVLKAGSLAGVGRVDSGSLAPIVTERFYANGWCGHNHYDDRSPAGSSHSIRLVVLYSLTLGLATETVSGTKNQMARRVLRIFG